MSLFAYSNWGASGYCNQAPECSPKLSYVAFSTLTQLLDFAKYEGRLETGTTSVYALQFSGPGGPLCVLWNLRGNSTWAVVYLGGTRADGSKFLTSCDEGDNFDGWRFLRTGWLGPEFHDGSCKIDRLVVTMPEQQVYVDDLMTTPKPEIAIRGLSAMDTPPPDVNYLPW